MEIQPRVRAVPTVKVGLKLHLNPYSLVISGYVALKCSIAGSTISGAKGSEATAVYGASGLPGYPLVQRHCVTCHSAQYVTTQPPVSNRSYWEATVRKMKKPFGAQFPDEDVPAMVDYLVKTYGAERTR